MAKVIRKTIRFSENEYEKLESQLNGKSFSDFAREILLNGKVKVSRVKKVDPELIYEINKIGNNLNQIARSINSQDDKVQILTKLAEIDEDIKNVC